jgi:hypothetical protein
VKDRVLFQSVTGLGAPSMDYFHEEALPPAQARLLVKMASIVVTTDVVRENNQTYRLGYTEMLKDGTKMGERLLRIPAGVPQAAERPHARLRRHAGDEGPRRLQPRALADRRAQLLALQRQPPADGRRDGPHGPGQAAKFFTDDSLRHVYDYERHVASARQLEQRDALPKLFACLAAGQPGPDRLDRRLPHAHAQRRAGRRAVEKHVCPLQFDIVDRADRAIQQPGEVVYDPFHGLGTVGVRAILKAGRYARGSELSTAYFADQVHYLRAAEREASRCPRCSTWTTPRSTRSSGR